MSIRVVLVDDHPIVRDGLRFSIARSERDIQVVGEAATGQEALDLAARARADVYVMDVTMPVVNGIEATRELVRRDPSAKVIMLSLHDSQAIVREALLAGARGFLTKETASQHVVDAIVQVHAGRYYLSPGIAHVIVEPFLAEGRLDTGAQRTEMLTRQERRILQLIGEGHANKVIATLLDVSVNTVHTHRSHIMTKLDLHDQASLIRYALKEGIAKA